MPDNGRGLSALEKALMAPEPITSPNLEPLPASSSSKAAIRRCRAAWKRAFDFYIESKGDNFMTRKKCLRPRKTRLLRRHAGTR